MIKRRNKKKDLKTALHDINALDILGVTLLLRTRTDYVLVASHNIQRAAPVHVPIGEHHWLVLLVDLVAGLSTYQARLGAVGIR